MPDDARTRAHEALFSAFGSDGSIMHVNPYEAVDALLAAGWTPPPAPASDDAKARATAVLLGEDARWRPGVNKYPDRVVDALAAAGLLAAPSHLDRLAAEMDARDISGPCLWRRPDSGVGSWRAQLGHYGYGSTAQEAAADVLARREATDG